MFNLLFTLGKILDKLVNKRLTNCYERVRRTRRRQFGFRRSKETVEALKEIIVDDYNRRVWHVLVVTLRHEGGDWKSVSKKHSSIHRPPVD